MVHVGSGQTQGADAQAAAKPAGQDVQTAVAPPRGEPEFAGQRPAVNQVSTTTRGDGGIAGNLVEDPLIRFSGRGKIMVTLRVASSKRIRDPESGQWREGPVRYHNVICWGQLAQNVGEHFLRGDLVVVVGVWQREEWIGAEGEPHQRVTLAARHIGLGVTFKAARYVQTIIEE